MTSHHPTQDSSAQPHTTDSESTPVPEDAEDPLSDELAQASGQSASYPEDSTDDFPATVQASSSNSAVQPPTKISLAEMFDFSNAYWTEPDVAISTRSLNDEFELYHILDQDAEGDPDMYDDGNDITHPTMM
ncbi:hypothetical protein BDN70DRAFT_939052 [Pholiota conissans]|uniref:Uncharacterized protein n=1 Tax=Pholiota conissans TaxID=109636 RepID=A0A9P5YM21_9AGAR|nr:hypothetical protein BDN70DRAFT_939052 [Pholiota conissans]